MKKILTLLVIVMIAAGMFIMTSCGGSFSVIGYEKSVKIGADNASEDTTSTVGGLEVAEGEKITINSSLDNGTIKIEVFKGPDDQSADEVPEPEGDPVMTFDASGGDSLSGTVDPGYYFVTATVKEKATGNIELIVEKEK